MLGSGNVALGLGFWLLGFRIVYLAFQVQVFRGSVQGVIFFRCLGCLKVSRSAGLLLGVFDVLHGGFRVRHLACPKTLKGPSTSASPCFQGYEKTLDGFERFFSRALGFCEC